MAEQKLFAHFKTDGAGSFAATFSRFGLVDSDGDVTLASAIPIGREVPISAWGHGSWQPGAQSLPIGRGVIRADTTRAWVEGDFFLDTTSGRDTYLVIKHLGSLQQWSYGFRALDVSVEPGELQIYGANARRILKGLDVFEASPVLVGAGVRTTTDSVKDSGLVHDPALAAIAARVRDATTDHELHAAYRRTLLRTLRHSPLSTRDLDELLSST